MSRNRIIDVARYGLGLCSKDVIEIARYSLPETGNHFLKRTEQRAVDTYDEAMEQLVVDFPTVGVRRYNWSSGTFGFLFNLENRYTVMLCNDGVTFTELGLIAGRAEDAHYRLRSALNCYDASSNFQTMVDSIVAAEIGFGGRIEACKISMVNWMERQVSYLGADVFDAVLTATVFRDCLSALSKGETNMVLQNLIDDLDRLDDNLTNY